MKQYIGTEVVKAYPTKRKKYYGDFDRLNLAHKIPSKNSDDEGYSIEYSDKETKPNTKYFSFWLPKELFEKLYRPIEDLNFGQAIELLKQGKKLARKGWNGKAMWLELQLPDAHSKMTLPYIYMKTADDKLVPWLASQTDMLAEDWQIVE